MRVLIIGGGGREHEIADVCRRSPAVEKIYAVPGNPGIAEIGECKDISLVHSFDDLIHFARREQIDLTIVGPEDILAKGIVDCFQAEGLRIFGPTKYQAQIETRKDMARGFMHDDGIPSPQFVVCDEVPEATQYVSDVHNLPVVIKGSWIMRGKGVRKAYTVREAKQAIYSLEAVRPFGGNFVIEEMLTGKEISCHYLIDANGHVISLSHARDHKWFNGEVTGGVFAYSPVPDFTPEMDAQVRTEIVDPTINMLLRYGMLYSGILYIGLMITDTGPKVLEYNCRFGDPEAQVILPRVKSDFIPYLIASIDGKLDQLPEIVWDPRYAACGVAVSSGYPGEYEIGKPIHNTEKIKSARDIQVRHAGTARREDGTLVTHGGRVVGVTTLHKKLEMAITMTYTCLGRISFDGKTFLPKNEVVR